MYLDMLLKTLYNNFDVLFVQEPGHSLAVCQTLAAWLAKNPTCTITFVQVPSKLEWSIHKEAHNYAKALISPAGLQTSLDTYMQILLKY